MTVRVRVRMRVRVRVHLASLVSSKVWNIRFTRYSNCAVFKRISKISFSLITSWNFDYFR